MRPHAQSGLAGCNPGIPQARILEWIAINSPGDLPNSGIEPGYPALYADSLATELQGKPILAMIIYETLQINSLNHRTNTQKNNFLPPFDNRGN